MAVQWFSQLISGLLLLIPGFDSTLVIVISVVDRLALRQIFALVFHFSTYEYCSTKVACLSSSTRCSYQQDKRMKPGNFSEKILLRISGKIR